MEQSRDWSKDQGKTQEKGCGKGQGKKQSKSQSKESGQGKKQREGTTRIRPSAMKKWAEAIITDIALCVISVCDNPNGKNPVQKQFNNFFGAFYFLPAVENMNCQKSSKNKTWKIILNKGGKNLNKELFCRFGK